MFPSSSFLAGFAYWSLVCHVQHPIFGYENTGFCYCIPRGCTHISSSENWVGPFVTSDVCVCVPWLSVQDQGLGGQCAVDGRGCH